MYKLSMKESMACIDAIKKCMVTGNPGNIGMEVRSSRVERHKLVCTAIICALGCTPVTCLFTYDTKCAVYYLLTFTERSVDHNCWQTMTYVVLKQCDLLQDW